MTKILLRLTDPEGNELIIRLPPGTEIPVGKVIYLGQHVGDLPVVEMEVSGAWIRSVKAKMEARGEA